jgi:UDP-N-acetylglucosamine transferase subunit ALG13
VAAGGATEAGPVRGGAALIFATVGSHPSFKFDRLLRALESVKTDDLVVQYGPGDPPANARRAERWMPFEEILAQMARASCVVSHGGVGTILCAVRAGRVPVVLPRLRRFAETVDDHQLELARALAETDRVILVEDATELADAIGRAPAPGSATDLGGAELIAAVRRELVGAGQGETAESTI